MKSGSKVDAWKLNAVFIPGLSDCARKIELFLMKAVPDAESELGPSETPDEATKFNVIVRVDYEEGTWERSGSSDVIVNCPPFRPDSLA
ncbi:hypothetical protein [Roseivivax sp. CAU 1761]